MLDTFALVAYLRGEPAADQVRELLTRAAGGEASLAMCLVNWGEVLYTVEREKGLDGVAETILVIDGLPIELIQVTRALAQGAARLKVRGGLSYADCYAAALGQLRGAAVVTGDREFERVETYVQIEWLPQRPRV